MRSEPILIYKLIILYMLDKIPTALPKQMITKFVLGHEYTNFFTLLTVFGELEEAALILADTSYKSTYYQLTKKGRETLHLFYGQLPHKIREEIEIFLNENKYAIIEEVSTFSDYKRIPNGDYQTTLVINENGSPVMELNLTVATEDEANKICNMFAKKKEEVYQYLIQTLLC